jgi:hypothetical protein
MLAETLTRELAKVCPIDGVLIRDAFDKNTWRIDFSATATAAQKDAATAALTAFDVNAAQTPQSVAMWQARAALDMAGLLPSVQAAVTASGSSAMKAAWEYSTTVDRNSDMVVSLGAGLGLTPTQIDAIFIQAAALKV